MISKYRKDSTKTRFESDDDLPLDKEFNIVEMIIVAATVLEKNGKYCPQIFLHESALSYKMLQYEKISVSEEIDTNKTSTSKERMLCHYWYFKDVGFKFEPRVCIKCHDILITAYELRNIAILNVKRVDFSCILWGISKNEAFKRLDNSVLEDKSVL